MMKILIVRIINKKKKNDDNNVLYYTGGTLQRVFNAPTETKTTKLGT